MIAHLVRLLCCSLFLSLHTSLCSYFGVDTIGPETLFVRLLSFSNAACRGRGEGPEEDPKAFTSIEVDRAVRPASMLA